MNLALFTRPNLKVPLLAPRREARGNSLAKVRMRELFIVNHNPWRLELHRFAGRELALQAVCAPGEGHILAAQCVRLTVLFRSTVVRPNIDLVHGAESAAI